MIGYVAQGFLVLIFRVTGPNLGINATGGECVWGS